MHSVQQSVVLCPNLVADAPSHRDVLTVTVDVIPFDNPAATRITIILSPLVMPWTDVNTARTHINVYGLSRSDSSKSCRRKNCGCNSNSSHSPPLRFRLVRLVFGWCALFPRTGRVLQKKTRERNDGSAQNPGVMAGTIIDLARSMRLRQPTRLESLPENPVGCPIAIPNFPWQPFFDTFGPCAQPSKREHAARFPSRLALLIFSSGECDCDPAYAPYRKTWHQASSSAGTHG